MKLGKGIFAQTHTDTHTLRHTDTQTHRHTHTHTHTHFAFQQVVNYNVVIDSCHAYLILVVKTFRKILIYSSSYTSPKGLYL